MLRQLEWLQIGFRFLLVEVTPLSVAAQLCYEICMIARARYKSFLNGKVYDPVVWQAYS